MIKITSKKERLALLCFCTGNKPSKFFSSRMKKKLHLKYLPRGLTSFLFNINEDCKQTKKGWTLIWFECANDTIWRFSNSSDNWRLGKSESRKTSKNCLFFLSVNLWLANIGWRGWNHISCRHTCRRQHSKIIKEEENQQKIMGNYIYL